MLKKLFSVTDTPEGVFLIIGLLWALAGKYLAWPVEINVAGLGSLSAAMFIAGSLGFVLVSLGWKPPFQPATLEQINKRSDVKPSTLVGLMVAVVLVASFAMAVTAHASETPPPITPATVDDVRPVLSLSRGALGVDGGYVSYKSLGGATQTGLRVGAWGSYSLTDVLSLAVKCSDDVRWGYVRTTAGARACVVGNLPSDRIAAYLAVDRVWLSGNENPLQPASESWSTGINLAWVAVKSGDRDLIYVKPQVSYDTVNGWDLFAGLGLNLIGGN